MEDDIVAVVPVNVVDVAAIVDIKPYDIESITDRITSCFDFSSSIIPVLLWIVCSDASELSLIVMLLC